MVPPLQGFGVGRDRFPRATLLALLRACPFGSAQGRLWAIASQPFRLKGSLLGGEAKAKETLQRCYSLESRATTTIPDCRLPSADC